MLETTSTTAAPLIGDLVGCAPTIITHHRFLVKKAYPSSKKNYIILYLNFVNRKGKS